MKSEHDQDEASFALLAQSFDTLSEAEHFLRPTPERAATGDQPPRKICVGLEERGDISPIKLEGAILEGADRNQQKYRDDPKIGAASARHSYGNAAPVSFAPMPYPSGQGDHNHHSNPQHGYYHHSQQDIPIYNAKGYSTTASNPFFVLRCVSQAFNTFSYKLSCLNEERICPVNIGPHSSTFSQYSRMEGDGIDINVLEKACSRVETALCAFGGTSTKPPVPRSSFSGIFRNRRSYDDDYYETMFHHRYTVKSDHIYWELECNPPVHGTSEPWDGLSGRPDLAFRGHRASPCYSPGISATSSSSVAPVDRYQKMRYRCKLCHQLKQNHDCPFRNSLHRSIGVTVHASINAFQAAEPGRLAPPLSEMNSCVTFFENENGFSPEQLREAATPRISPETDQTRPLHYSPESSLSSDSGQHKENIVSLRPPRPLTAPRPFGVTDKPLFVESVDLKPGQLRIISSSEHHVGSASFSYPPVPLPFEQRKRLSDTLFALAGQVPRLKEECAALLRCARGNNEWDLGVAQLLCQLVVGLYCAEGDFCLDGLKRYLQRMGISC